MHNYTITNKGDLNRLLLRAQTLHHAIGYELGKPPKDAVDVEGKAVKDNVPVKAINKDTGEELVLRYIHNDSGAVWTGFTQEKRKEK